MKRVSESTKCHCGCVFRVHQVGERIDTRRRIFCTRCKVDCWDRLNNPLLAASRLTIEITDEPARFCCGRALGFQSAFCPHCGRRTGQLGPVVQNINMADPTEEDPALEAHHLSAPDIHEKEMNAENARATTVSQAYGPDRPVDYTCDPPDEDCPDCVSGCERCAGGIIPWEWSINWDALAAAKDD